MRRQQPPAADLTRCMCPCPGDKLGRDPRQLLLDLKDRVGVHTYCFSHITEHTKQVGRTGLLAGYHSGLASVQIGQLAQDQLSPCIGCRL